MAVLLMSACPPPIPDPPPPGCEVTGCTNGRFCDSATHTCVFQTIDGGSGCVQSCAPNEECVSGTCTACTIDTLCTAGLEACRVGGGCTTCREGTCGSNFSKCQAGSGCSECNADTDCPAGRPYCGVPRCMECRTSADCAVGTCFEGGCHTTCNTRDDCPNSRQCVGGRCLACDLNTDCPSGEVCTLSGCAPGLPGERCESGIPLLASETRQTVAGSGFRYSTSRVWYTLTIPFDAFLTVEAPGPGAGENVELYVNCTEGLFATFPLLDSSQADITGQFIGAGTYALAYRVSGFPDENVARNFFYSFSLSIQPATRSAGSDCSNAIALPLSGAGTRQASVQGDTTGAMPLRTRSCGEMGSVTYRGDVTENSVITATLTPMQSGADLGLWMNRHPCTWLGDSCQLYVGTDGGAVTSTLKNVPAGSFPIIVSALSGASAYSLDVTKRPYPSNGTCASAQTLTFDGGVVVVNSDTTYVDPTFAGCGGSNQNAVFYTFSTRGLGERSVSFDLSGSDGGMITLRSTCPPTSTAGEVLECSTSNADAPRLPEGRYFVQVDGAGPFTLRGTIAAPIGAPSNDLCAMAIPVASSASSWGPVTGDTRGAAGENGANCNGAQLTRDVFYRVTTPGPGRLSATVTPSNSEFDPILTMGPDCSTTDVCISAQPAGLGEVGSMRVTSAAIVGVRGSRTLTEGAFSLAGTFQPAPANDLCAGALPLPFGGNVTGSVGAAFAETNPCTPSQPPVNLYYSFTAPANGQATVTLQPTGFDGTLSRLASCGAAVCGGSVPEAGGVGVTETMTFAVARNAPYVVIVGARDVDPNGTFTLSLTGP